MKGLVSRWSCNVLSCSASANINFEFFFEKRNLYVYDGIGEIYSSTDRKSHF